MGYSLVFIQSGSRSGAGYASGKWAWPGPTTLLQIAGTQAITSGASRLVTWDTLVRDEVGAFTRKTPTQIITPPGFNRVRHTFATIWSSGTGVVQQEINMNGSNTPSQNECNATSTGSRSGLTTTTGWLVTQCGDLFQAFILCTVNLNFGGQGASGNNGIAWWQAEWAIG